MRTLFSVGLGGFGDVADGFDVGAVVSAGCSLRGLQAVARPPIAINAAAPSSAETCRMVMDSKLNLSHLAYTLCP